MKDPLHQSPGEAAPAQKPSTKTQRYMHWGITARDLPGPVKTFLKIVLGRMDFRDETISPALVSHRTLASDASMGVSTVYKLLSRLDGEGLVERQDGGFMVLINPDEGESAMERIWHLRDKGHLGPQPTCDPTDPCWWTDGGRWSLEGSAEPKWTDEGRWSLEGSADPEEWLRHHMASPPPERRVWTNRLVWERVLVRKPTDLPTPAKGIALDLALFCRRRDGEPFRMTSRRELCRMSGFSLPTVTSNLQLLEQRGWIHLHRRLGAHGGLTVWLRWPTWMHERMTHELEGGIDRQPTNWNDSVFRLNSKRERIE